MQTFYIFFYKVLSNFFLYDHYINRSTLLGHTAPKLNWIIHWIQQKAEDCPVVLAAYSFSSLGHFLYSILRARTRKLNMSVYSSMVLDVGLPAPWPAFVSTLIMRGRAWAPCLPITSCTRVSSTQK